MVCGKFKLLCCIFTAMRHDNLPEVTSVVGWDLGCEVHADGPLSCCGIWTWYSGFFWTLASDLGRDVALSSPYEEAENSNISYWESKAIEPYNISQRKRVISEGGIHTISGRLIFPDSSGPVFLGPLGNFGLCKTQQQFWVHTVFDSYLYLVHLKI